jgi:hypothetical protein
MATYEVTLDRPLWFIEAAIEGQPWQARWTRETGRREWVEIISEQSRLAQCA